MEEREEMRRVTDGPGPPIELSAGSLEVMKYTLPNWSRSWFWACAFLKTHVGRLGQLIQQTLYYARSWPEECSEG